jgi:hypothetical protein
LLKFNFDFTLLSKAAALLKTQFDSKELEKIIKSWLDGTKVMNDIKEPKVKLHVLMASLFSLSFSTFCSHKK